MSHFLSIGSGYIMKLVFNSSALLLFRCFNFQRVALFLSLMEYFPLFATSNIPDSSYALISKSRYNYYGPQTPLYDLAGCVNGEINFASKFHLLP